MLFYPHIHVNMYVYSTCKYVVNKLKLKLKLKKKKKNDYYDNNFNQLLKLLYKTTVII